MFAPLANRLGIWQIKWELEDLAFRFLEPEHLQDASRRLLDEKRVEREASSSACARASQRELAAQGMRGRRCRAGPSTSTASGRRCAARRSTSTQVFDVVALRVIVADVDRLLCGAGLGARAIAPIAEEFDDYIARPKPNGYQSLHTVVRGRRRPRDRNPDPHRGDARPRRARRGGALGLQGGGRKRLRAVAAGDVERESPRSPRAAPAAGLGARSGGEGERRERSTTTRAHVPSTTASTCCTPQARVIELPQGATPIDFAYTVHTSWATAAAAPRSTARWCR